MPPEKKNAVKIPKFDKAPVIDGNLNDAIWQTAVVLKDFYQIDPGDNVAPSKPTEVLIGYDPKFLYVAFRAFDEPDKVRSTVAKRDNIFSDDYVGFYLDTFKISAGPLRYFSTRSGYRATVCSRKDEGKTSAWTCCWSRKASLDPKGTQ